MAGGRGLIILVMTRTQQAPGSKPEQPPKSPPFVQGSILKHLVVLTFASAMGLLGNFIVDFVDIYFITLLGDDARTSAVGVGSTLTYFVLSLSVAVGITISVLVSRAMGAGETHRVKQLFTSILTFGLIISVSAALVFILLSGPLVRLLGTEGTTAQIAAHYMRLTLPGFPFMGLVMWGLFAMRLQGFIRLGLYLTLSVSVINAILDPIFIFVFDWKVTGAALASTIARIVGGTLAFVWIWTKSGWLQVPSLAGLRRDLPQILKFYLPAVVTNLSTPIGTSIAIAAVVSYGESALAGASVVAKMIPVLFAFVLSLSGSVGPVVGQNFGARQMERVRESLLMGGVIVLCYTLPVGLLTFLLQGQLVQWFGLSGEGEVVLRYFAGFLVFMNGLAGLLFVANSVFNNLGYPLISTGNNLFRDVVLMFPLTWAFAQAMGAKGALLGQQIATLSVAVLAFVGAIWLVGRVVKAQETAATTKQS